MWDPSEKKLDLMLKKLDPENADAEIAKLDKLANQIIAAFVETC